MPSLTITTIQDETDLKSAKEFMLAQKQFYPNHREWVDGKCSERIESGLYKSIIGISEGKVVGIAVYRCLPNNHSEIKNFRIDNEFKNRDLGHFLLTQAEVESKARKVTLDTTVDNFPAVQFFIRNGFNITGKENLYVPDQDEYLMTKQIIPRNFN